MPSLKRIELEQIGRQLTVVQRNLALAANDEEYRAISGVFSELKSGERRAGIELASLDRHTRPVTLEVNQAESKEEARHEGQEKPRQGENAQAINGQKGARGSGQPRRHRGLDPACHAGPASHRQATGRTDLRDDHRASIRRQVEKAVLRFAGAGVDHRDGRLRRLRKRRVLRRRGLRPPAPTWNRWTEPLREGEVLGGGTGPLDARVDRTGTARARLEMMVHEVKTQLSAKLQLTFCGQR